MIIMYTSIFIALTVNNEYSEKKYFRNDLTGDCLIKNSTLAYDGNAASKSFTVDVPQDGHYYINAWVRGLIGKTELDVFIDKQKLL